MTVGARELAGEHRVPAHVGRGLGLRVRSREDRPATAAWRLCSRPTRAESRQREACIGRARCRTRSTAYSAAPAAETLTRCRPSACLQAIGARDGRRASSRRRALPRRRACRAGRRGSGLRCPSCSTSCVGSALSHGFSNRLARDIVVIDVRGPLRMCISEYAPGYEAQHGISFEMATKWRQAAGGEPPVWLLSRATFPLCSHESPTPSHVQGTALFSRSERIQL